MWLFKEEIRFNLIYRLGGMLYGVNVGLICGVLCWVNCSWLMLIVNDGLM